MLLVKVACDCAACRLGEHVEISGVFSGKDEVRLVMAALNSVSFGRYRLHSPTGDVMLPQHTLNQHVRKHKKSPGLIELSVVRVQTASASLPPRRNSIGIVLGPSARTLPTRPTHTSPATAPAAAGQTKPPPANPKPSPMSVPPDSASPKDTTRAPLRRLASGRRGSGRRGSRVLPDTSHLPTPRKGQSITNRIIVV